MPDFPVFAAHGWDALARFLHARFLQKGADRDILASATKDAA
jgi:hypothetical protein